MLKRLEKLGKNTLIEILGLFLRTSPILKNRLSLSKICRILVVRPDDRLGNMILLTPLLGALRRTFPDCHIALLVSAKFADLLTHENGINEQIRFSRRGLIAHPLRMGCLWRCLREGKFDLAIDARHMQAFSLTSALLTYATGAPLRLGYDRGFASHFLNLCVPLLTTETHETEILLNLLRFLIGKVPSVPMQVFLSEEDRRFAGTFLARKGVTRGRKIVGLHLGGRRDKRWPVERYAALADALKRDFGADVMVFGGPDEAALIPHFQRAVRSSPVIVDAMPIGCFGALVEHCHCFISGDTGPMHLSVALGTPTISLFLVNNFRRYGPSGEKHRVVYGADRNIAVEEVLKTYRSLPQDLSGLGADRV